MASYPALMHLTRILGRADTLAALGCAGEPDPATLTAAQRERLSLLVDARLESVATALVDEAAASDDVTGRGAGRGFVRDRLATFGDLLTPEQAAALLALAEQLTADWD